MPVSPAASDKSTSRNCLRVRLAWTMEFIIGIWYRAGVVIVN